MAWHNGGTPGILSDQNPNIHKEDTMTTSIVPTKRGRLDRLFNDDWGLPDLFNDEWRFPDLLRGLARFEPEIKVEETVTDGILTIRAEAPGIDPDKDVDIEMTDGALTFTVQRRESTESKQNGSTRSEFRYGSFQRTLLLPEGTLPADVKATYKDGILEVKVPVPTAPTTPAPMKVPVLRD
ncbi:unannotated protein [freshwater metagenome]|uniref:Unannotated protein n=1 Tax=freshwater metagenome TaxID=449393 RepID=A0A6J7F6W6_9ZZZZ|nr:Hsp20 family protein [Actinomycetota bacterium]